MARGLYLSRSILGNTQWDGANSACNRESLLVAFRCRSCCCLLFAVAKSASPVVLLFAACDCDANHKIRHSSVFLVFSFNPLSYQIFLVNFCNFFFFLSFRGTIFGLFCRSFVFFCLISVAYLLRGVGVQICLLFVGTSVFLVSSTPYNPRSRCSSLLKLAAEQESFCFALLSVCVPEGGGGCGGPVSSLVVSTLFLSPQCLDR
jgi:hypothetical protein